MSDDTDTTKTVCFDLDGTLCTNTYGAYDEAEPFPWAIARLNALAASGHRIVVFTARGTATGIDWADTTRAQLDRWGVRYDDVKLGKPSADVYVDDRAVHTTAWREGDAFGVPGLGLPMPPGAVEELPAVLAPQRTMVVQTGRTYAGRPFQLDAHVARVRQLARGAGIASVPTAETIGTVVETAITRAGAATGSEVVFTIALADGVSPAFLDVSSERTVGPVVTVRPLAEALAGLRSLQLDPAGTEPGVGAPAGAFGGTLAVAVDGRLVLGAPPAGPPPPSAALVAELARDAGVAVAPEALAPEHLARADGAFETIDALGLVRILELDGQPVGTDDTLRARLAAQLSERVGLDVDAEVA